MLRSRDFTSNIAQRRLINQHLITPRFVSPAELVGWLGAVQAQDYLGALWAIGLRLRAVETEVELSVAARSIVRTWPMRGTLHFVAAADIRWMLDLLAPRAIASSAGRLRELELDDAVFSRCRDLFIAVLSGGKQLTREAMLQVLTSAQISTTGQRGIHILGRLAQEGLICFGARQGKQHTFALLEEWTPQASLGLNRKTRDEALAELTRRYFTGHGPAKLTDFVWWSGLTTAAARAGLAMARPYLEQETSDGETYWFPPSLPDIKDQPPAAYLLPAFDEYLVGYKDRGAVLDPEYVKQINPGGGLLSPTIIIDGQVVGTWKRTRQRRSVVITPDWFAQPGEGAKQALALAARQYGAFLNLPVTLAQAAQ
jgi:hypothetical protein